MGRRTSPDSFSIQKNSLICVLLIESREGERKKGPETWAINVSKAHIVTTPAIAIMLAFRNFFCVVLLVLQSKSWELSMSGGSDERHITIR